MLKHLKCLWSENILKGPSDLNILLSEEMKLDSIATVNWTGVT